MDTEKNIMQITKLSEQSGICSETFLAMKREAIAASQASYSPYSKFAVGAAILTDSDNIFSGCNVENASYGLSNCAERTAIFTAVTQGERTIKAIVIYTPTEAPASPCGACRQVINEFGVDCLVVSVCDSSQILAIKASDYLPHGFGPNNLIETA